ncbi:RNA polymerase sigma factor [Gorillibacterium timonense]|uniref:RNA polymerase sigma factor n=1 Tax=Gorillibacterium timonense TaxID=1689269 RepID=UPI00071E2E21|nr:sigma-70 family RNA polymerase sigma factor [Gorillibacterium timonense]
MKCRDETGSLRPYRREGEREIEDEAIVAAVLEGRTECFRLLVERYRIYLYHVALSVVRNPKDAEDVTQEAFLKIYSALPGYRKQGFKTWITRIATNKAIDHARKMRRRKEQPDDEIELMEGNAGPPLPSQEERMLDKEKRELLHERIREMPKNYRDVVLAYYFEEKSYQEIAAMQNVEMKTVESKLYRARQWIRRHWKEEDFR